MLISDHADPLAQVGSKEAGGQNIYVYYLSKFLSRKGIFVDVFTRWDKKNKKEVIQVNKFFRVIRVKAGPKKYMPRDFFLNHVKEFGKNIVRRMKNDGVVYDVMHCNYWFSGVIGLSLKKKLKIPMLFVFHSIGKVRFEALKNLKLQKKDYIFFRKRNQLEKKIAKNCDFVVSTSPVEKKIVQKTFNIPAKKIKFISIGIDKEIFYRRKKLRLGKKIKTLVMGRKIVLYVGRIEWRKGIGTLIYAFKQTIKKFPKSRLLIVGGGRTKAAQELDKNEINRLKNIVKELKLGSKVCFLGPHKQKELNAFYNLADVCVVPSYYEPFGIVPIEAMACGTPVVASRIGGLQYTVKNGKTGFLAKVRNYRDLSSKINKVISKDKDFFSDDCLRRIEENFSWEKIAEKYEIFFSKIVK